MIIYLVRIEQASTMFANIPWYTAAIVLLSTISVGASDGAGALLEIIHTYGKMNSKCACDMGAVTQLHQEINSMISLPDSNPNAINARGKKVASKLRHKTRTYIVHKESDTLARLLDLQRPYSKEYTDYIEELRNNFDVPVISAVFARALDSNLFFKTGVELAEFLWEANKYFFRIDKTTLTIMLDQQLQLFWKSGQNGNHNDNHYIFRVSYYFYKVRTDQLYSELDVSIKRRLDAAIRALPSTMQNFYFKPYFCLLNKRYKENIYTALHMWNAERRKVYSWLDPTWVEEVGYWQHEIKERSSGGAENDWELTFLIRSDKFKRFLYMEPNLPEHNNIIAVWEPGNVPSNSAWSIELIDNYLIFSQDGFIMCNSEILEDASRRYLYGFNDPKYTKDSEECQWIVDLCERNK